MTFVVLYLYGLICEEVNYSEGASFLDELDKSCSYLCDKKFHSDLINLFID